MTFTKIRLLALLYKNSRSFQMGKRLKRILLSICICLGVLCALFGCGEENSTGKFEKDGLSITLTSNFSAGQKEGYTAYYQSSQMVVATKKEPFASFENVTRDLSLCSTAEYVADLEAEWYRKQSINSWQGGVVEENGLVYFTYEDDEFGDGFKVCCFGYKSADAFWSVRFGCEATNYEGLKKDIFDYAKTVKLNANFVETLAFEKIEGKEEYRLVGLGTVCALDIVVPAEYNGLPVTEIGSGAFGTKHRLIKSVVLPDSVTKIERGLFSSMYDLKRVQLGNAVTVIDEYAFQQCSYLEEVVLPDTVTTIGMEAFAYCYRLKNINLGNVQNVGVAAFFQCKALETLEIPKTMIATGYSAFAGCEGLKSVTFPDTLQTIGTASFQGCISLTEIVIPDSVTLIEEGAFDQCFALEKVTIPDSVTSIGISAFTSCPALQYTEYEGCLYLGNENNPYLYLAKPVNNQIGFAKTHAKTKIIAAKAFLDCNNLMHFEVGESITEIGFLAFENCVKLLEIYNRSSLALTVGDRESHGGIATCAKHIYFEEGQGKVFAEDNGVVVYKDGQSRILLALLTDETRLVVSADITEIYPRAFYKKTLESLEISDTVTGIGEYAFYECGLEGGVTFGNGVLKIGEYAFAKNNMTSLCLPESLEELGANAFKECTACESIVIGNRVKSIGEGAFSQCTSLREIIVPDSVVSLGDGVFEKCQSLANVTIGNGVVANKTGWFGDCKNLKTVVLGDNIKAISDYTFYNREQLKKVVVGSSLETVGKYTFYGCNALVEVEFGENLITIDDQAFAGCSALSTVQIPKTVQYVGAWAFSGCTSLQGIEDLTGLVRIGESAFSGCSALKTVTLGEKLTAIRPYAFSGCKGLTEMTIPDSVETLGVGVLRGCDNVTKVQIGSAVKDIPEYAFDSCINLTTVWLPETIESIHSYAFNNCPQLEYNKYDNASYLGNGQKPYVVLAKAKNMEISEIVIHDDTRLILSDAFSQCKSLTRVKLPNGLIAIGSNAFLNCGELETVNFPETLQVIGRGAFSYCANLKEAILPDSLKELGDSAFMACKSLKTATLPAKLQMLNNHLFANCEALETVVIPESVTEIGNGAFSGTGLAEVTIPDSVTKIQSSAFSYCKNLRSVALGKGVTLIDALAFARCGNLRYVIWSATNVRVGDGAFDECEAFDTIYFSGQDEAEMWGILSLSFNEALVDATVYLYSETEPALNADGTAYNGNFWRYKDGNPTVWV